VWWVVDEIRLNLDTWWQITVDSLATVLTEWAVVVLVLIGLNWWMGPLQIREPQNHKMKKVLGFFVKFRDSPTKENSSFTSKYTSSVSEWSGHMYCWDLERTSQSKSDLVWYSQGS